LPQPRATSERIDVDEDDTLGLVGDRNFLVIDADGEPAIDSAIVLLHHGLPAEERIPDFVAQLIVKLLRTARGLHDDV
jgi:hypothetical protein